MARFIKLLFVLIVFFSSCKKNDTELDYRDQFIGNYTFENIYSYPTDDSIRIYKYKSINYKYNGSIKKTDGFDNKITVDWGNDTIGIIISEIYTQKSDLTVDSIGNLSFPEYSHHALGNTYFNLPSYIRGDTIKFNFTYGGHMWFNIWDVKGIKKK